jgi:NAD(P)-dependent dehydrogenase (short-subunit alcohol dehydrogenase family)
MNQRVAVVTGANRGIGFEVVRQLAKLEMTVVLTSRDKQLGQEAVELLHNENLLVRFQVLDVTDGRSVSDLTDYLLKEFNRCDVLVNNAGIFPDAENASFFNSKIETIREAMETNVYGPILLSQAIVPLMKKIITDGLSISPAVWGS